MKNLLLITAVLSCMVSAMAQTPNNYRQKLDSVFYNGEAVERLEYDNRFNCTKIDFEFFNPNMMYSTIQFTYDNDNRFTKTEYWYYFDDSYESYDISDNDMGLVSEKVRTYVIHDYDYFVDYNKYTYEYDESGALLHTKGFHLNVENEWKEIYRNDYFYEDSLLIMIKKYLPGNNFPNSITKYTYNNQGLCTEIIKTQNDYDIQKIIYTYDGLGRKLSETIMEDGDGHELVYKKKQEYQYNTDGDCTIFAIYDYLENDASWLLNMGFEYTYDLSTSVDDIAGLKTYWNNSIEAMDIEFGHRLLSYKIRFENGTITDGNTFHYSNATGIAESTEKRLHVWPNPVDEVLHIETKDLQQVEIISLDGKNVLTLTNGFESINVSTLASGCYLLKATKENGIITTKRFVKQ